MAVLVEALSVIIRRDAIEHHFRGGWSQFLDAAPNETLCCDDELARVGFMSPEWVEKFLTYLDKAGISIFHEGKFIEAAVVDQVTGPTLPTSWLEFGKLPCDDDGHRVSACWLFEGERKGAGLHFKSLDIKLALPVGWNYENSLSNKFEFVRTEDKDNRLKFLRAESDCNIYFDKVLDREVSIPKPPNLDK